MDGTDGNFESPEEQISPRASIISPSENEPNLSSEERVTIDTYNAIASRWAGAHDDANFWSEELKIVESHFFKNGSVLEACVGGGRDTQYLKEFTGQYTGVDVSDGLLLVAQDINSDAELVQVQDLRHLPFADDTFDGFWSSATLLYEIVGSTYRPISDRTTFISYIVRVIK